MVDSTSAEVLGGLVLAHVYGGKVRHDNCLLILLFNHKHYVNVASKINK